MGFDNSPSVCSDVTKMKLPEKDPMFFSQQLRRSTFANQMYDSDDVHIPADVARVKLQEKDPMFFCQKPRLSTFSKVVFDSDSEI